MTPERASPMRRDPDLRHFVDTALAAFTEAAPGPAAAASLGRIATALAPPAPVRAGPGQRLPVCAQLATALGVAQPRPSLARLGSAFRAIGPRLEWVRRASLDETASANFADGHANTMIPGPAGLENRPDVWLGASLLAPQVR